MGVIPVAILEEQVDLHIYLYESQIEYLKTINEKANTAIKILIDKDRYQKMRTELNMDIIVISLGLMMMVISSFSQNYYQFVFFMILGVVLSTYGLLCIFFLYKKWRKRKL